MFSVIYYQLFWTRLFRISHYFKLVVLSLHLKSTQLFQTCQKQSASVYIRAQLSWKHIAFHLSLCCIINDLTMCCSRRYYSILIIHHCKVMFWIFFGDYRRPLITNVLRWTMKTSSQSFMKKTRWKWTTVMMEWRWTRRNSQATNKKWGPSSNHDSRTLQFVCCWGSQELMANKPVVIHNWQKYQKKPKNNRTFKDFSMQHHLLIYPTYNYCIFI